MSNRCVCTDCAIAYDYITQVDNEAEQVFIVHTTTAKHDALNLWVGDECEVDHNHAKSKSCEVQFKCGNCSDLFDSESDAQECCEAWECNFCGWVHKNGWYSNAQQAATTCCVTSCDDCGETGWPSMFDDHECDDGRGMRRQLPWEARGVSVDARKPSEDKDWKVAYAIDPEQHNVVRAAADYYLLEAMAAGLVGTTDGKGGVVLSINESTVWKLIRNEAQEMKDALVREWDPILINYVHMAVGGELRHHNSVGSEVLSTDRDRAWCGWKYIFEAVGPDALTDAAELFREFTGGSFGGDPWAQACEILHARLTGKLNPSMFLDRVFNAQHNGGCLMNKVHWAGDRSYTTQEAYNCEKIMQLDELTYQVLPAHGVDPEPDYSTLLAYASAEVKQLFSDCYTYAAHAAVEVGTSLSGRRTKPSVGETRWEQRERIQAKQAKLYALKAVTPKYESYFVKMQDYLKTVETYKPLAKQEIRRNAKKQAKIDAGEQELCPCGVAGCYANDVYISTYYQDMVKSYQENAEYYGQHMLTALAAVNALNFMGVPHPNPEPLKVADTDGELWKLIGSIASVVTL